MTQKNKKDQLNDFLRYHDNKMTGEERNSFERELQKDPFAEEAEEGFSMISADEAKEDILLLQKRLDKILKRRPLRVFYRIAASVAVLMVITTIFIITQRNNQIATLSENISQKPESPLSILLPEPLTGPVLEPSDKKLAAAPRQPTKSDEQIAATMDEKQEVAEQLITETEKAVRIDSVVVKSDIISVTAYESAAKSVARDKRMDMAGAASAPVNARREAFRDYLPPQPIAGKDSFDIYIEKNIRNPEPGKSEQQVVLLSIRIRTDSTMSSIKVIDSPGQAWSKEAIRLIREGPVWKPAEENGKQVEDEVRVRIIFR